jgi:hypothetical protein
MTMADSSAGRRTSPHRLCAAVLAMLTTLAPPARAQSAPGDATPLYIGDVEPHYYRQNPLGQGLFHDMMRELSILAGHPGAIQPLPLARELAVVRRDPRAIGAFARTAELETSFTWLCPLLTEEVLLIADKRSPVDISSVAAARGLRVGVLRASPSENAARELGFTHVEAAGHPEDNARKLAIGRLDALLSLRFVAAHGQRRAGLSQDALRYGAKVQRVEFFLAGAPQLDPAEADKWRNACALLRKTGSHERLLRKYLVMPAAAGGR